MPFTVTFPTTAELPEASAIASWVRQRGEPHAHEGADVELRALDVRIRCDDGIRAELAVGTGFQLSRVVDLLFDLSIFLGADVRLTGVGEIGRGQLWMRLADEQDRSRIDEALMRAELMGRIDEVSKRLWLFIAAIRPGRDDRWDAAGHRIVEMREVGAADGISLADAAWHKEDPEAGDVVPVPVEGMVHTLAWRWLSEAYPNLCEREHTLH